MVALTPEVKGSDPRPSVLATNRSEEVKEFMTLYVVAKEKGRVRGERILFNIAVRLTRHMRCGRNYARLALLCIFALSLGHGNTDVTLLGASRGVLAVSSLTSGKSQWDICPHVIIIMVLGYLN